MSFKASSDLDTNRQVRQILVRHWIDLGRLSLRSIGVTVYLRGSLLRLPGVNQALLPQHIQALFQEIRRCPAVKRALPEFDNWSYDEATSQWRMKSGRGDDKAGRP